MCLGKSDVLLYGSYSSAINIRTGSMESVATEVRTAVFTVLDKLTSDHCKNTTTNWSCRVKENHIHYLCVCVCVCFLAGFKCPVCSKFVSSDEMDLHLVLCLTKPRVTYNGRTDRLLLFLKSYFTNVVRQGHAKLRKLCSCRTVS